jgi:truncated hemoglobin YjbI
MFEWLKPHKKKEDVQAQKKEISVQQGGKPNKQDLIKQAMLNAREAREAIGQETLDRVLDMMQKKKQEQVNPAERARKIITSLESGHVADNLKDLLNNDPKKLH